MRDQKSGITVGACIVCNHCVIAKLSVGIVHFDTTAPSPVATARVSSDDSISNDCDRLDVSATTIYINRPAVACLIPSKHAMLNGKRRP